MFLSNFSERDFYFKLRRCTLIKKLIIIIFTIIIIFSIAKFMRVPKLNIIDENELTNKENFTQNYIEEEKICLKFLEGNMMSESGGIYTNYLENFRVEEMAGGHEILSESEGLIMLYYVKTQDKDEFDKHFDIVKNKMLDETGLIKWRIKEDNHELSISSATIDDLRIARALIYAYDIWEDKKYYKLLKKINKGMLKYNIYKGCLNNYYDMKYKDKAEEIDAAYIDLYTIKLLSNINNEWFDVYNQGINVIEEGYLSNEFPLYEKTYDITKSKYLSSEVINSIDTLLVVLHLSEVGLVKNETIEWIKDQLIYEDGIYIQYNIKTGKPINKIESTATYAIAARIAKNIGDKALYEALINKMLSLQVVDEFSLLYGGFGDIDTLKVYSFDNLQALLAFKL